MMLRKMSVRACALAALGAMVVMLGGCHSTWTAFGLTYAAFPPAGAAMGTGIVAVAAKEKHGPTGTFLNDSDDRLWVRWWVGKVNVMAEGGVEDWRSPAAFVVGPGEKVRSQLGRNWWVTANSDAVVRIAVRPVVPPEEGGTTDETSAVQWYEFERTPPYFIKALGNREDLVLMSFGKGSIAEVPVEQRFQGVSDDFPVVQAAAAGM